MKYKIIFLMLFSMIFFIGENKAYSCPDGWQEISFVSSYRYSYAGGEFQCDFRITYCCGWDAVNRERVIMFKWISAETACFLFLPNWSDFLNWLHVQTKNHADTNCYTDLPPCDDTTRIVYKTVIVKPRCAYYQNWRPRYPGEDPQLILKFCDNSSIFKCVYKECLDFSGEQPTRRTIFLYSYFDPLNCDEVPPELPPPGKTSDDEWITSCFLIEWPSCPPGN